MQLDLSMLEPVTRNAKQTQEACLTGISGEGIDAFSLPAVADVSPVLPHRLIEI